MRLTRRSLFVAIAAAVVGKPAALIKCQCLGCQYARGVLNRRPTYEFYPDAFTAPPNQLPTMQEITYKSLQVLENNIVVLPSFYRE